MHGGTFRHSCSPAPTGTCRASSTVLRRKIAAEIGAQLREGVSDGAPAVPVLPADASTLGERQTETLMRSILAYNKFHVRKVMQQSKVVDNGWEISTFSSTFWGVVPLSWGQRPSNALAGKEKVIGKAAGPPEQTFRHGPRVPVVVLAGGKAEGALGRNLGGRERRTRSWSWRPGVASPRALASPSVSLGAASAGTACIASG